jgi:hypothetical protein
LEDADFRGFRVQTRSRFKTEFWSSETKRLIMPHNWPGCGYGCGCGLNTIKYEMESEVGSWFDENFNLQATMGGGGVVATPPLQFLADNFFVFGI